MNLFKRDKAMFLAYDQGLEHGPTDFNDKNVDPAYVIEIARKGKFSGLILQKGIAERYNREIKSSGVPLILKLNGKTSLVKGEPLSVQLCTVKEALKLGAKAVGYTIYIGSANEAQMLREFEGIEREAHSRSLSVIAWIYPRGKAVDKMPEKILLPYAARAGLELGADIVKLHWSGDVESLKWAVKSAGRCRVVVAGGSKKGEVEFLKHARDALKAGASGVAVGRNIWQSKDPVALAEKLRKIVWAK